MEPRNMPSLNQSLFGSSNNVGATKVNNKNIADTSIAQRWIPSEMVKGYNAIKKKTIVNTIPKDFVEDCST